ncbi:MAG: hypothetical protein KatS3mg113_0197 [Planctomycetaceae bacterium]|nr:MAG: hypothetical protein KatS3mg113_0197 [Planctomycetaceae bacterium]
MILSAPQQGEPNSTVAAHHLCRRVVTGERFMNATPIRRRVIVKSIHGLHIRPCTIVAQTAAKFASRIQFRLGDKQVDAKSIMDLLTLAASCGTELEMLVDGPDAPDAAQVIGQLFDDGFDLKDELPNSSGQPSGL